MSTVILVRHGLTHLTGPVLAGWTPGLHLDERGEAQAKAVAERLAPVPLADIVSSPLDRCLDTAGFIAAGRDLGRPADAETEKRAQQLTVDERIGEARYGDWTGKPLKELAKDPLWKVVQAHPSAVTFPGPEGEALAHTQARAVAAVREHDARLGPDAVWVVCSHGDVIKSIVADAMGMHLDSFQRIMVDPCSVTVIRYTELRPFVVRVNDTGGSCLDLVPPKKKGRRRKAGSDAAVGGGAG